MRTCRTLAATAVSSALVILTALTAPHRSSAAPLAMVENGTPALAIWYSSADQKVGKGSGESFAAQELVAYLAQMSGAQLPMKCIETDGPIPADAPAVIVGQACLSLGCPPPPKTPGGDGYRVLRKGNRLFLLGETARSTYFATSHFLELNGCRWFFDNRIGTVIPELKTIAVDELTIEEKPDFIYRNLWGPNWRGFEWTARNRLGGLGISMGHAWSQVSAKEHGDHPEYFAMNANGERKPGSWVCTSNPDVRRIYIEKIRAEIAGKGPCSVSLSPPDGTGFCNCPACKAQDVPDYREPSSGRTIVSDRYVDFFNAIANGVRDANPEAILCFYAYSDYSRPPLKAPKSPDNLCVFIAPIRFCRFHGLDSAICEPRQQLRDPVVSGWSKGMSKIGWREYNYNLAELVVPLSKISVFRHDLPYLHKLGCIGMNLECLAFWHTYGPHTYLATKLLWDVDADVDAVMDDFYTRFCGPAAPYVKAYWQRIDDAYRTTDVHSGSYFSLQHIWTPAFLAACAADLDAAAKAADSDVIKARVDMFRMGLDNAKLFMAVREAENRCDFAAAKERYDKLLAHMDAAMAKGLHQIGEYKYGYLPRFVGKGVEAGYAAVTSSNSLVAQLPEEWFFRYDTPAPDAAASYPTNRAAELGCLKPDFSPDDGWKKVHTYTSTLSDQGVPEQLTWMWYATDFELPDVPADRRLTLFFTELDGRNTMLIVNGQVVGNFWPKRQPASIDVTGKLRKGRNTVVLATDHGSISELMLGGILRPVMVCATKPTP